MKRIIALVVIGILVLAGLAWTAGWFYIARQIRAEVLALAAGNGQTTPRFTCAKLGVTGYPFGFAVSCAGARLVSGDTTLTLPRLRAGLGVFDLSHVVATATGPLRRADAFTGSKSQLDWTDMRAHLTLKGWRIGHFSLLANKFAYADTTAGRTQIATLARLDITGLDIPEQFNPANGRAGLAIYATADNFSAPGAAVNGAEVSLEADLDALPDDIRTFGDAGFVGAWQRAGGAIKLYGLKAHDANASLDIAGTLALDPELRAQGQLKIVSKGLVERFGNLVPQHLSALLLGAPAPDGTYSQTLNLRAGVVMDGIIPVAALPPLH